MRRRVHAAAGLRAQHGRLGTAAVPDGRALILRKNPGWPVVTCPSTSHTREYRTIRISALHQYSRRTEPGIPGLVCTCYRPRVYPGCTCRRPGPAGRRQPAPWSPKPAAWGLAVFGRHQPGAPASPRAGPSPSPQAQTCQAKYLLGALWTGNAGEQHGAHNRVICVTSEPGRHILGRADGSCEEATSGCGRHAIKCALSYSSKRVSTQIRRVAPLI